MPFNNRKELGLAYAHFLKIYVALTSLRNTEVDAMNWEYCYELPFRVERLARGEEPYAELPQALVRLKKSIDFADPQRMLLIYGEVEQGLINLMDGSDIDEVTNFLFTLGPSLLSFIILRKSEPEYLEAGSYRKRMLEVISYIVHKTENTVAFKRSNTFAIAQALESKLIEQSITQEVG